VLRFTTRFHGLCPVAVCLSLCLGGFVRGPKNRLSAFSKGGLPAGAPEAMAFFLSIFHRFRAAASRPYVCGELSGRKPMVFVLRPVGYFIRMTGICRVSFLNPTYDGPSFLRGGGGVWGNLRKSVSSVDGFVRIFSVISVSPW
jgi:hypothetical protein